MPTLARIADPEPAAPPAAKIAIRGIGKRYAGLVEPSSGIDPTYSEAHLDDMRKTTEYLLKAGRIRQNIDSLSYSNTALLKEIDPALVKIEGKA